MNRNARRAARLAAVNYRCPDCNADTRLEQPAPGAFVLSVMHDLSCPAYQAITHRGPVS